MSAKKSALLGMPIGTASARLLRAILFRLVSRLGENVCHRCGETISAVAELSIEHKDSWQYAADPVAAFFDLDNVSFSHKSCNYAAAHRPHKRFASAQEREAAYQPINTAAKRAQYDPAKRRDKYLANGH